MASNGLGGDSSGISQYACIEYEANEPLGRETSLVGYGILSITPPNLHHERPRQRRRERLCHCRPLIHATSRCRAIIRLKVEVGQYTRPASDELVRRKLGRRTRKAGLALQVDYDESSETSVYVPEPRALSEAVEIGRSGSDEEPVLVEMPARVKDVGCGPPHLIPCQLAHSKGSPPNIVSYRLAPHHVIVRPENKIALLNLHFG